jgi:predicted transposase/invertase (TIGR01784 family)
MGAHDSGYKQLFSFPTMVEELLRGFVRERWIDELDFDTLERKNGSYVSDDLREREDDIIWRVKWRGANDWMYVYFLIEFQSEHDWFMAVRVWTYLGLLYQDLIRTGEAGDRRLPPVLPMVVYRGEQKWKAPLDVKELVCTPPSGLVRYLPSLRYLLLEEVRLNEKELDSMSNLVAEIFRIEKSATLKASIPPFLSFMHWTTKAGAQQDSLKRAFIVWYKRAQKYAKIIDEGETLEEMSPEEMEPMLSERIEKWTEELRAEGKAEGQAEGEAKGRAEGEAKGRAEGEAKGRAEGKAEMFLSLFEMKFGTPSSEIREQIKSAGEEEIQLLSARLLTADTASEIFLPEAKGRPRF